MNPKTCWLMEVPDAAWAPVDGNLEKDIWSRVPALCDFSFPWESVENPPKTVFKALVEGGWLRFSFDVEDDVILYNEGVSDKMGRIDECRVEMYFAPDPSLKERYCCLEMNSRGDRLDYSAKRHRNFDFSWSFPADALALASRLTPSGYALEGKLSIPFLMRFGMPSLDKGMSVGLFRADFIRRADGALDEHWMCWAPPSCPEPDFHVPSAFGVFRLFA